MKKKNSKRVTSQILILLLMLACATVFTFSFIKIVEWYRDNRATESVIDQTQKDANLSENSDKADILGEDGANKDDPYWSFIKMDLLQVDFSKLKQRNSDTVGWIQVKGTNINYPFVQTKDNDYYLHRSYDRSPNSAGWVFADYRNNMKTFDKNTILYAHGRYDMTMFGSLKDALKSGWLNDSANHIVRLSTEYENTMWQVFSVYHIPTTTDYLRISFNNKAEYGAFLNTLMQRSAHNFGTNISAEDKILTLSTCYNKQERMVLHAKLIKRQAR